MSGRLVCPSLWFVFLGACSRNGVVPIGGRWVVFELFAGLECAPFYGLLYEVLEYQSVQKGSNNN